MENVSIFNAWKADLENVVLHTQIDCLRIIELNVCNACNLSCSFCPHSQNYKYNQAFIDLKIVKELKKQLDAIAYDGYICIAGHGEPTLHKNIIDILKILQPYKLVLVTNGISLSSKQYLEITTLCQIKVSIHDISKKHWFEDKFKQTNAIFRNHDNDNPQMNLYNRAGNISSSKSSIQHKCNYPFYKIMIDINGTYALCEADWSSITNTSYTLFEVPIDKYFCDNLNEIRIQMLNNRQNCKLCKKCNIDGQLIGNIFVDFWQNNKLNLVRDLPYKPQYGISTANEPPDTLNITADFRRYPDMNNAYNIMSKMFNVPVDCIMLGNGVENVMKNVLLALKPTTLSWSIPTWGFVDVYCAQLNIKPIQYSFKYQQHHFYEQDMQNLETYYMTYGINNIISHDINYINMKNSKFCIIDVSYLNIFDVSTIVKKIMQDKELAKKYIIIGSFDKSHGAGLRLGFAIFPKKLSNKILLQREIFINSAAIHFLNNIKKQPKYFYHKLKNNILQKIHSEYLFLCNNFLTIGTKQIINNNIKNYIMYRQQVIDNIYLYRFGIPSNINEFNQLTSALFNIFKS